MVNPGLAVEQGGGHAVGDAEFALPDGLRVGKGMTICGRPAEKPGAVLTPGRLTEPSCSAYPSVV